VGVALGPALLLPIWLAGWASRLAFLPLALVRIPAEEQMMLAHFGAEYRAYQMDTGGIVPRLHAGAPRG